MRQYVLMFLFCRCDHLLQIFHIFRYTLGIETPHDCLDSLGFGHPVKVGPSMLADKRGQKREADRWIALDNILYAACHLNRDFVKVTIG